MAVCGNEFVIAFVVLAVIQAAFAISDKAEMSRRLCFSCVGPRCKDCWCKPFAREKCAKGRRRETGTRTACPCILLVEHKRTTKKNGINIPRTDEK